MPERKALIEIQYFEGCPNSEEMVKRVLKIVKSLSIKTDYKVVLVETPELAQKIKFRGSPTVLVNGFDLENMPEPKEGNLACRYYRNGLPDEEQIKNFIMQQSNRNN
jgi:hypothetical protein